MDFIDQIKQFSKRAENLKNGLTTEEATKTAIIMPFFQLLGYDVFNPEEFVPEYTADVGIKKGEKVDYAIMNNGEPVILIECKWIGEDLQKHDSQLFRYFGTTNAKFAILTNGQYYRFYTDLEEANKMDETPFLEINIFDIKGNQVAELKKFHKSQFDVNKIFDVASDLKYSSEFKTKFAAALQQPSDEFVRLFLSGVYEGKLMQSVVDRFRPVLKKSLNDYINELMSDKIKSALDANISASHESDAEVETVDENQENEEHTPNIFTTQEELEAFFVVKNILRAVVPADDITYKDNERYMTVLYKNKTTKWVCRFYFNTTNKYITVADENKKEVKHLISNVYDIENYKEELIETLNRYVG